MASPHFRMCFLVDTYAKLFTRECTRRHHVSLFRTIPFRYCLRTKVRWSSPLSSRSDSGFLPDSFSHVNSEIPQVIMVFIVSYARERILSLRHRPHHLSLMGSGGKNVSYLEATIKQMQRLTYSPSSCAAVCGLNGERSSKVAEVVTEISLFPVRKVCRANPVDVGSGRVEDVHVPVVY